MTNNLQLETVSTDSIPEPQRTGRGHGKYFAILTNFVEGGEEAALVHFDGEVKASTVAAYMRKLSKREGWGIQVLNRQGRVYLVRD